MPALYMYPVWLSSYVPHSMTQVPLGRSSSAGKMMFRWKEDVPLES
jgi:hypothetical protein